jgi:hypothetical protein
MLLDAPVPPDRPISPVRLLTGHFLRRFLDNDLVSPNADRHETLTVGATMLVSSGLFVSVLVASKYVMNPFPTPVDMALGGIQDRFLFVAASMVITALVAAAQWDALSIDARDAAILGPLPVTRGTIVFAKLAALVLFVSAFVLILNAGPTVLFPLFFASQLPLGLLDIARLLLGHGLVTLAAGGFGAAAVVAFREGLRALLGERLFQRTSTFLQATLVVLGCTVLLLLPGYSPGAARAMLESPVPGRETLPPLWFVGLHEVIAGHLITRLPARRVPERIRARERRSVALYQRNQPRFRSLATTAVPAFASVAGLALAAFAWNNRRLPYGLAMRATRRPRWRRLLAAGIERWIVPRLPAQAGFFFTLQVLPRSAAHRVAMAAAVAAGLAGLIVAFSGVELHRVDGASTTLGVWAAQHLAAMALLFGFRHAVRVPAELKASGSFLIAWPGDERGYLSGVKRAALLGVIAPVLLLLLPLHVVLLGPQLAGLHAVCGLLLAQTLLEALCYGMRHPPFVCAYVPAGSFKRAAPIYFAGIVVGCLAFAALERAAFHSEIGTGILLAALVAIALVLRWRDGHSRREPVDVEIDQAPDGAVRLDLSR